MDFRGTTFFWCQDTATLWLFVNMAARAGDSVSPYQWHLHQLRTNLDGMSYCEYISKTICMDNQQYYHLTICNSLCNRCFLNSGLYGRNGSHMVKKASSGQRIRLEIDYVNPCVAEIDTPPQYKRCLKSVRPRARTLQAEPRRHWIPSPCGHVDKTTKE